MAFDCRSGARIAAAIDCRSGARIASAKFVGLGCLRKQDEEIPVLDTGDVSCRAVSSTAPASTLQLSFSESTENDVLDTVCVENDLVVSDFDWSDESASLCSVRYSGLLEARKLMISRAQQCVVCMEEKEHTFVPPHVGDACQQVHGHRFCSECWMDFLEHSIRQQPTGKAEDSQDPPPLSCPVCRGIVTVPDVWGACFELPDNWLNYSDEAQPQPEITVLEETEKAIVPLMWVPVAVDDAPETPSAGGHEVNLSVCRRAWNTAFAATADCLRGVVEQASQAAALDLSLFDASREPLPEKGAC